MSSRNTTDFVPNLAAVILALLVILAALLSGCGGGGDDNSGCAHVAIPHTDPDIVANK